MPTARGKGAVAAPLEAGILWVPVPHEGTPQQSPEEAEAIAALVRALMGRSVTDLEGRAAGRHGPDHLLVVAPYNQQVPPRKAVLPKDVAIVSLTASDAEGAARGLEFVLDPHRTNVAISRAMSLAIVVGSPTLTRARAASVEALRLVNTLCRIVHEGTPRP